MKFPRILVVGLLMGLFLLLGWVGGRGNPVDWTVVERLADVRVDSPRLTWWVVRLTDLGNVWTTLGAAALAAIWLLYRSAHRKAGILVATVVGGRLLCDGLKLIYGRPRPSFDLHPVATNSYSFPSGHAANTMVAFVAIALFVTPERYRRPAILTAIFAAAMIGMTRPYLGVHWPSDTLGGWLLAASVLLLSVAVSDRSLGAAKQEHEVIGGHRPPIDRD